MTPDVNCRIADLPTTIPAYVVCNYDGSFTIILNARHTHERQLQSFYHEMHHINHGDYEKNNADMIEIRAHGMVDSFK